MFCKSEVDFGSYVLLKTIKEEPLGDHILDLGCGYGVIGVTVKKMFPDAEMLMVDVNPRAVELAVLNAQKNRPWRLKFGYRISLGMSLKR